MANDIVLLKNLINNSPSANNIFKRNLAKDYLQIQVLNFIYSHPIYSQLFFYGGSCLAHCHDLPRLSEDLDFVDSEGNLDMNILASGMQAYLKKSLDMPISVTIQKFRIYLKFPILRQLGLSDAGQTDLLFIKIEVFKNFNFCASYKTEIIPLFKYGQSILIKTFDLPTLMATKIRAILNRRWTKTDKNGNVLASVKGRDYFDLMWYSQKGVKPNISCIEDINSIDQLKNNLLKLVEELDPRSIQYDLEAFIEDANFVGGLSKNIKDILRREVEKMA